MINPAGAAEQLSLERQKQYLEDSRAINIKGRGRYPMTTLQDKTWRDWQERTGELPPDFALMPSKPFLPDPLVLEVEGTTRPVATKEDWEARRRQIREQYQYWVSGNMPPAPTNLEAHVLEDRVDPEGARVQMIELRFGPEHKGKMTFELIIPPGDEPRPVYLTQWNHRDWAQLAVRRGYIGCVYAGADVKDDSDSYHALYPGYEWSQLMRRAWGASRVVDYLLTRQEVNKEQIAITGHSRNGKQSLWATAFDDRIGAVISSSCGTGGIMPWRFSDPQYCNETLDWITGVANVWFQPRLRYFFGREDKLPVDQNLLLACIAPRPLLMHYSHMEHQSNAWAAEQCYHSVKTAYEFLGEPENISMLPRQGEHAVAARDVEQAIDFLDAKFGRRDIEWKTRLLFDWNFEDWVAAHADDVTSAAAMESVVLKAGYEDVDEFLEHKQRMRLALDWLLGEEPAGATSSEIGPTHPSRIDWMDSITGRPEPKKTKRIDIGPYAAMGDHLPGTLYVPVNDDGTTRSAAGEKLPVIIYLHQYAYAHGYALGYSATGGRGSQQVFQRFTDAGFAVFAIDMFGFGTRLMEAQNFYLRQPEWSKMGKMVNDVSACVDALETFDFVDQESVFVVGDTIGGIVGLMAAAQDERIDAVATVAAFSPWRASNSRYESIRVHAHQHGFLPRLGLFADEPGCVPVDFGEILACVAPRPLMVIAPELDRHSDPDAVAEAVKPVQAVYELMGAGDAFQVETPREINRMTPEMQKAIIGFLSDMRSRNSGSVRKPQ